MFNLYSYVLTCPKTRGRLRSFFDGWNAARADYLTRNPQETRDFIITTVWGMNSERFPRSPWWRVADRPVDCPDRETGNGSIGLDIRRVIGGTFRNGARRSANMTTTLTPASRVSSRTIAGWTSTFGRAPLKGSRSFPTIGTFYILEVSTVFTDDLVRRRFLRTSTRSRTSTGFTPTRFDCRPCQRLYCGLKKTTIGGIISTTRKQERARRKSITRLDI